jgi:hypothetical protein
MTKLSMNQSPPWELPGDEKCLERFSGVVGILPLRMGPEV